MLTRHAITQRADADSVEAAVAERDDLLVTRSLASLLMRSAASRLRLGSPRGPCYPMAPPRMVRLAA